MLNIYTGGTYDCGHLGHLGFLKKIKRYFPDSFVVIAVNKDDFIKKYKGKNPLFNFEERCKLLETISEADLIIPNIGGSDSTKTIKMVEKKHGKKIDVIVIGNDWLQKDYCKQMNFDAQWLTDNNIALCYLPHTDGISTTLIKERIKNE
jgi:glycerol-3-phosphate cytidylyltransferase